MSGQVPLLRIQSVEFKSASQVGQYRLDLPLLAIGSAAIEADIGHQFWEVRRTLRSPVCSRPVPALFGAVSRTVVQ